MNIDISVSLGGISSVAVLSLWTAYVIWYSIVLWSILRRPDWQADQRTLWFLVITLAPVIGLVFHMLIVFPPTREKQGDAADQ
jgi:hypothetical protein